MDSIADAARRKLEAGTRRQAATLLRARSGRFARTADTLAGLDTELRSLLGLLAEGLTVDEISKQLSYSPRTIDRRLATARRALRVETTAELLCAVREIEPAV